jgi:hypothetical protein
VIRGLIVIGLSYGAGYLHGDAKAWQKIKDWADAKQAEEESK